MVNGEPKPGYGIYNQNDCCSRWWVFQFILEHHSHTHSKWRTLYILNLWNAKLYSKTSEYEQFVDILKQLNINSLCLCFKIVFFFFYAHVPRNCFILSLILSLVASYLSKCGTFYSFFVIFLVFRWILRQTFLNACSAFGWYSFEFCSAV